MNLYFKISQISKVWLFCGLSTFLEVSGNFAPVKIFGNNNHSGICPDHNWVPPHGVRKPMPDPNLLFHEGSILRYVCDNGYELSPPNGTQKCHNGIWTPSRLPNCVPVSVTQCTNALYVHNGYVWNNVPVDVGSVVYASDIHCYSGFVPDYKTPNSTCTETGSWSNDLACVAKEEPAYCSRPPNLENGVVFCCEDKDHNWNETDFCCFPGGKVQFECDSGYYMSSGDLEWQCSSLNTWTSSRMPVCTKDFATVPSHSDQGAISDGMIKMVVAVTSGILALLLIVVAFAFCKPRLKEIKRRWRDFREDENGLIVDGRRVNLPTYEQATSNNEQPGWSDFYHQVAPTPCLNPLTSNQTENPSDVTRPPQSNVTEFTPHSTSSHPYSPLSNEDMPQFSPNPPSEQFQRGPEDQLTVVEFLREFPSTSTGISAEISGFEDNFVSVYPGGRPHLVSNSPTSSLSSNEAISAPLLTSSSRQRSVPNIKIKCKSSKSENENDPTIPAPPLDQPPLDLSSPQPNPQPVVYDNCAVAIKEGDSLGLDHISLNVDESVSSRDPNHADSTTV